MLQSSRILIEFQVLHNQYQLLILSEYCYNKLNKLILLIFVPMLTFKTMFLLFTMAMTLQLCQMTVLTEWFKIPVFRIICFKLPATFIMLSMKQCVQIKWMCNFMTTESRSSRAHSSWLGSFTSICLLSALAFIMELHVCPLENQQLHFI